MLVEMNLNHLVAGPRQPLESLSSSVSNFDLSKAGDRPSSSLLGCGLWQLVRVEAQAGLGAAIDRKSVV